MPTGTGRHRESGFVLPSWVALTSLGVVALAVVGFFVTGSPEQSPDQRPAAAAVRERVERATDAPTRVLPAEPTRSPRGEPPRREPTSPQAYVEVYNNSTVSGLAAQTAGELQDAGWNVVGTDNWYGAIPASTVYYPERLRDQARLLARDLGLERVLPAVSPMRFDRLTVILTAAA